MKYKINISIVLYNNPLLQLENLINDLLCCSDNLINKICLIDNSDNDRLSCLQQLSEFILYVKSKQNVGYGSAHNVAMELSIKDNIKYHLVVNPDIRLNQSVLSNLIKYMECNSSVGLVMPNIIYPDGSRQHLCKLLPSPMSLFSRRFLPRKISDQFNRKYNLLDMDYSNPMNVPLLSGCFMFMRTSAIAEVGMFDPRFFMYLEDFDLVRRIHAKYQTMFLPSIQVTHEYAKGSYKNKKLMLYHICSAIRYFNKWGWFFDLERKKTNKKFLQSQCILKN